eukprot:783774-Pelagomonas_calceolata.AAC.2
MAALTECQLSMLEQMFPRHVLEYMVSRQPNSPQADDACGSRACRTGLPTSDPALANQLASSHENVTILFTE